MQHATAHQNENCPQAEPDLEQAYRQIEVIAGHRHATVTFQTINEGAGPFQERPVILHGTLAQHRDELLRRNGLGQGIFMMVNEGDGRGRTAENVVAVRALFTDDDGDGPTPKPSTQAAPPSLVVESARGLHNYWTLEPGQPLSAFTGAQAALAAHFSTDRKVKDLARVMRLAGFLHQKHREHPFLVKVREVRPERYTIRQILTAYPTGIQPQNEPMHSTTSQRGSALIDGGRVTRRAKAYLSKVPGAVQGKYGDDLTYQVACILIRDFGLTFEQAFPVFHAWNQTCTPPWSDEDLVAKLQRAEKYGTGETGSKLDLSPDDFAGTRDLCFIIPLGRYYLRRTGGNWDLSAPLTKDPATKHLRSLGMAEKAIANTIKFDLMPLAHGIDCSPGEGPVFSRDGRLIVNCYVPSRIVPKAGDWPRIQAIMKGVTDDDLDGFAWLLNWIARAYQNPGSRSMTAPVFQGQQGWGKTVLGLIVAALIGEENTACISQADLESQFNGHFVTKLFIVADEVVNQESLRDSESILKKYVTDPRIVANVKNTPQYEVVNRMSWWFTSNKVTPVKVEGPGDRRYAVFAALRPVPPDHKAMLRTLFRVGGGFTEEFEQEMAAFAHALAAHQVDEALATQPLHNAARAALIDAGRNSTELFLAEIAERGIEEVVKEHYATTAGPVPRWDFGDDGILVDAVYGAYTRYCAESGTNTYKRERLGQDMRFAFPGVERTRASDKGKRVKVYKGLPRRGRPE